MTELDRAYHDNEWGVPCFDDVKQFEYLSLEALQCGLTWLLMLKKRQIFRACFDNFDFYKVANYTDSDVERIMNAEGMIKSERKIRAIINNARCAVKLVQDFGSISNYLWSFTDGVTIIYQPNGVLTSNKLSEKISKDMKKRGFKYLGRVTIFSHLEGCGIINSHDIDCKCYEKCCKLNKFRVEYVD